MKRAIPWTEHVDVISSDESSSSDTDDGYGCQQSSIDTTVIENLTSEGIYIGMLDLIFPILRMSFVH